MNERLLRDFINEALRLSELKRDEKFIALLRRAGLGTPHGHEDFQTRNIADEWLEDMKLELGREVPPGHRAKVYRFVKNRWQGLVARFRGDRSAARQTMYNLLDTKFNTLRMGGE
jgi:hypothetical protein